MKTKLLILLIAITIPFTGCETVKSIWNHPETQKIAEGLKQSAYSFAYAAGTEAAREIVTGEKFNAPKVGIVGGAAALYTAAIYIRQLQGTNAVLNPIATAQKLQESGIPLGEAIPLANAITANAKVLESNGIKADVASEINASAFDAAAKAIQDRATK